MNDRRGTIAFLALVIAMVAGISALSVAHPGNHAAQATTNPSSTSSERM